MGAREAAQYTYRLLEEPYSDVPVRPRAEPAPVEPLRPTPPTPSQIPIQSMVTSEVLPRPVHRKQRTRLVTAGIWVAGLTLIAGLIAVASDARLASDEIETPLIVGIAVSGSLLGLGVLRVFTGRGFTGLIPAAITGFGLVVACVGFPKLGCVQYIESTQTCSATSDLPGQPRTSGTHRSTCRATASLKWAGGMEEGIEKDGAAGDVTAPRSKLHVCGGR